LSFEWDEAKRRRVIAERGLDFMDAALLFDGRPVLSVPSPRRDEERWLSIGLVDGRFVAVVWVRRGDRIRIVTARRARDEEKRRYEALFGA
jgi:hypothetical protein